MIEDLLLFGYGSLIFRPALPTSERRWAWLRGYERRFWQGSPDHRGTAEAPGRVVTLVEVPDGCCFGVLYQIDAAERAEVLARLDHRERAGYERLEVSVDVVEGGRVDGVLTYRAGPNNPNFLGPAPLSEQLRQVRGARGVSGSNLDYVLELDDALREQGVCDEHVQALAGALGGV